MDLSFYKGKKVLVTGHTGFKGSWLCRILFKAGAEVTGYSLVPPTEPNLFSMIDVEDKMNSVIGDIRDLEHLKKVFEETQPEIVLHLAAQPIVRESYKDPVYTYETNVMDLKQPLVATNTENTFDIDVKVNGGGFSGQTGAIRLGIARALLEYDKDTDPTSDTSFRKILKAAGLVTRDSRAKERKKPGLKAARRAPQFSKR